LDFELALSVSKHFRLKDQEAEAIINSVKAAVAPWRERAKRMGLSGDEIDRMAGAFKI
jgi:serine/threonine-protein kinase HipA